MLQLNSHSNRLETIITEYSYDTKLLSDYVNLDLIDSILRKYFSSKEMRKLGCFFTGQALSEKLLEPVINSINDESIIFDPCCGAGNLLIQASKSLTINLSLKTTLQQWGKQLNGIDIQPMFIKIAKLRLIIEALNRGCRTDCSLDEALNYLPNIYVKSLLNLTSHSIENVTHFLVNPPFNVCESPLINYWKKGKVNSAGVFTDYLLRIAPEGSFINFILPDVLRSGSRYSHFRSFVESEMSARCEIWGRFNNNTNVDVFLLSGTKDNNHNHIAWFKPLENYTPLSTKYNVSIGSLVAYRDLEKGQSYPYLHAKNASKWDEITEVSEFRKFSGKVVQSPFVVIKRTSSPSDADRASACIINIPDTEIAVENHLIVVQPKNHSIEDCRSLLDILKNQTTNDFLNDRARMRHLTVTVVKDIPI